MGKTQKTLYGLLFIIILFLWCITCTKVNATIIDLYGETTAKNLNVRLAPSGKIIGNINEITEVKVVQSQNDYFQINWFDKEDKKNKSGWVSRKYVKIFWVPGSRMYGSTKKQNEKQAKLDLAIEVLDTNLECINDYVNNGFDRCHVSVNVGLRVLNQANLKKFNKQALVSCHSYIGYTRSSRGVGFDEDKLEGSSIFYIYKPYTIQTILLENAFTGVLSNVVSAQIKSTSCQVLNAN